MDKQSLQSPWTTHESDGFQFWYSDPDLGGTGESTWEDPTQQEGNFADIQDDNDPDLDPKDQEINKLQPASNDAAHAYHQSSQFEQPLNFSDEHDQVESDSHSNIADAKIDIDADEETLEMTIDPSDHVLHRYDSSPQEIHNQNEENLHFLSEYSIDIENEYLQDAKSSYNLDRPDQIDSEIHSDLVDTKIHSDSDGEKLHNGLDPPGEVSHNYSSYLQEAQHEEGEGLQYLSDNRIDIDDKFLPKDQFPDVSDSLTQFTVGKMDTKTDSPTNTLKEVTDSYNHDADNIEPKDGVLEDLHDQLHLRYEITDLRDALQGDKDTVNKAPVSESSFPQRELVVERDDPPSLPPPPPASDRRPTLPPRPNLSFTSIDDEPQPEFLIAVVNRRGNIQSQAILTVNVDEEKVYIDNKLLNSASNPFRKVYAVETIEKLERHRSKPQLKIYFQDGTRLKVLFGSRDSSETFGALVLLINNNISMFYEGEWVDEISSKSDGTTYVCYQVTRKGAFQTEKRILCVDVHAASVLVVEPSVYEKFCGREACKKFEKFQRQLKTNKQHLGSRQILGLESMKIGGANGHSGWMEIKVDKSCAIKVHAKHSYTHTNVQNENRMNHTATGDVNGVNEETSLHDQTKTRTISDSETRPRSRSSHRGGPRFTSFGHISELISTEKLTVKKEDRGSGSNSITLMHHGNGTDDEFTRKEEFSFASAKVCARFCGYLNPYILGIDPNVIRRNGWKAILEDKIQKNIFITTWNVGETKPSSSLKSYTSWLRPQKGGALMPLPNIFVIGLQECKKSHRALWLRALRDSIDDAVSEHYRKTSLSRRTAYNLVSSVHMVQMSLYIFVAATVAHEITDVRTDSVPTGIGGMYGNKGAVAIGIQFRYRTRVAFVCSHLAARVQRVSHRASDYREITGRLSGLAIPGTGSHFTANSGDTRTSILSSFKNGERRHQSDSGAEDKKDESLISDMSTLSHNELNYTEKKTGFAFSTEGSIASSSNTSAYYKENPEYSHSTEKKSSSVSLQPLDGYDHIFWFGDLNYRVHIKDGPGCDTAEEYKLVQKLITGREYEILIGHDQLRRDMAAGRVFCGFKEHRINFAPTYRMKKGTNGYVDYGRVILGPNISQIKCFFTKTVFTKFAITH